MKTLNSLTSMRGLAALGVVLFHIWELGSKPWYLSWLQFGWSGVGFFFVLSSYLLVQKWRDGDYLVNGSISLRKFYIKRVFRTWPMYWITITISTFVLGVYQAKILPLNYLYLQNYFPSTIDHSVFWTLCIEEAFYFLLPLFMSTIFATKNRVIVSTILTVFLSLGTWQLSRYLGTGNFVVWSFPFWFVAYCFGALLAFRVSFKSPKVLTVAVLLVGAWIIADQQVMFISSIFIAFIYFLFISTFQSSSFLNSNPTFIYLGKISYSLYAVHTFAMLYIEKAFNLLPIESAAIGAIVSIPLAMLTYHLIEKPFINLGAYLIDRRKPAVHTKIST